MMLLWEVSGGSPTVEVRVPKMDGNVSLALFGLVFKNYFLLFISLSILDF
jgi:hypothetical protein